MYYSHSFEDEQFGFFASFVRHLIDGETKYRQLVFDLITDTHKLATKELDYYSVDRNNFPIIAHLLENDEDFFKSLDTTAVKPADLEKILSLIEGPRETALA